MGRSKREKVLQEIESLQVRRRTQYLKCALILVAVVAIVGAKIAGEAFGLIAPGNVAVGAFCMFSSLGLAILGGMASIEATKCTNTINGLAHKFGIRKEEYARKRPRP